VDVKDCDGHFQTTRDARKERLAEGGFPVTRAARDIYVRIDLAKHVQQERSVGCLPLPLGGWDEAQAGVGLGNFEAVDEDRRLVALPRRMPLPSLMGAPFSECSLTSKLFSRSNI